MILKNITLKFITSLLKSINLLNYFNRYSDLLLNYTTQFISGILSLFITSKMSFLLNSSEINNYELIISISAIIVTLSIWGYDNTAIFDESKKRKKKYLPIYLMILFNSICFLSVVMFFSKYFYKIGYYELFFLVITNLSFSVLSNMMIYSGYLKIINYINITSTIIKFIFILIFVNKLVNYQFWVYSIIYSNLVGIILLFFFCRENIFVPNISIKAYLYKFNKYTKLGSLLILPQILSIFSEKYGRIFVSFNHLNLTSATYQLAMSTSLIVLSLNVGYSRYFASDFFKKINKDNKNINKYIKSHNLSYLLICSIGIISSIIFWKIFILKKYSESFDGIIILTLLCLSYTIDGFNKFYIFSFNYIRKYKIITFYMTSYVFTYIIFSIIFNKIYPIVGISFATFLSNLFLFLLLKNKLKNELKK